MFSKEKSVLNEYIKEKNLRHTEQRNIILEECLRSKKHFSAEEIYSIIRKKNPEIGIATVYRTLKLLHESGICSELVFDDGITRYEPVKEEHHDHLICEKCGKIVEIVSPVIEDMQMEIADRNGFTITRHRLEIYGKCQACRSK